MDKKIKKELLKKAKLTKTEPNDIKYMIPPGVDINDIRNNDGNNLIYIACKFTTNMELIKGLYEQGCDPNITNREGMNSFDGCFLCNTRKKSLEILDFLYSKGVRPAQDPKRILFVGLVNEDATKIIKLKWALKHYEIEKEDKYGEDTCIHHCDNVDQIQVIIDYYGKNKKLKNKENNPFNIQNKKGETKLHILCGNYHSCPNILNLLLKKSGIDVNIKNKKGEIAYEILKKRLENWVKSGAGIHNHVVDGFIESKIIFDAYNLRSKIGNDPQAVNLCFSDDLHEFHEIYDIKSGYYGCNISRLRDVSDQIQIRGDILKNSEIFLKKFLFEKGLEKDENVSKLQYHQLFVEEPQEIIKRPKKVAVRSIKRS